MHFSLIGYRTVTDFFLQRDKIDNPSLSNRNWIFHDASAQEMIAGLDIISRHDASARAPSYDTRNRAEQVK
jgi:hypothetical protein